MGLFVVLLIIFGIFMVFFAAGLGKKQVEISHIEVFGSQTGRHIVQPEAEQHPTTFVDLRVLLKL